MAAIGFGCECSPSDPARLSPIEFVVDDAVEYAFFDAERGMRTADSIEQVPLEQRAAVVLVTGDDVATEKLLYVADLLDAEPKENARARPMSRRDHFQRARAAQSAGGLARRVQFMAQEVAQLDPRSDRSAASREARERLDKLVPRETSPESP